MSCWRFRLACRRKSRNDRSPKRVVPTNKKACGPGGPHAKFETTKEKNLLGKEKNLLGVGLRRAALVVNNTGEAQEGGQQETVKARLGNARGADAQAIEQQVMAVGLDGDPSHRTGVEAGDGQTGDLRRRGLRAPVSLSAILSTATLA